MVRARLLLGAGLLTSEGDEHLRHRRALQPAFHASQVADYRAAVRSRRASGRRPVVGWGRDRPRRRDVGHDAGRCRVGAVRRRPPRDRRRGSPVRSPACWRASGWPWRPGAPGCSAPDCPPPFGFAPRKLSSRPSSTTSSVGVGPVNSPSGPVLDLLAAQPELTDQQVRDEVMTLLLAGHETTAMSLTWALAAIDQAPAVRAELEAEWAAQSADLPAGESTDALPLTMAVLAETLRLWPPSWMFTRRSPRADRARWAYGARGHDVPGQPGSPAPRPAVVGRSRAIPAGPLAAACAGECGPLRPQGAGPTPRCLSALRGRTKDVHRGAIRLVGSRDHAVRDGPDLATPRTRCSADRRPLLDDLATGRPGAGDDRTADVVIWPE